MSHSEIYHPSVGVGEGRGRGGGGAKRWVTFQTIHVDHSWDLELRVYLTTAEAV